MVAPRATATDHEHAHGPPQEVRMERVHVDIDDICLRIVPAIPDVLKDHRASQDVAFVACEVFQHGIFLRRQVDSPPCSLNSSCRGSIFRSRMRSAVFATGRPRSKTARMRARSSATENGLTR